MKGLLDLFESYSSRSSGSAMCRHLLLWLVLLLVHSTLTQDMSARPTVPSAATTVQSIDAFTSKTGFETPITNIKFITEIETLLPTDSTEKMLSGSLGSTLTPSLLVDTVPTTQIGETSFTEISYISSTELVTRMRPLCCPEGFLDVEGNCFRFESDETNFDEALDRCNFSSGGSLAKIDPIEPTTQYLLDISRYYSDNELIWIGLQRFGDDSNDTFTWTFDETTLNISNWADGEPIANTSVNCATMSRDGTWVLRPCGETYLPYICQLPPVFCAELTTAPEVTTEEFTTAEITEIMTNATTTTVATTMSTTNPVTSISTNAATTNMSTTPPTTMTTATIKTSTLLMTTKLTRKPAPETTIDEDDEVTTEMMTEEETTKKSTAPTTSSSSTNRTASPGPTRGGNVTTNVTIGRPEGSTARRNPTTVSLATATTDQPSPPTQLSVINRILIAIIVIFVVLAIIIGCMVIYLIYKRRKGKKAVYNVKDVEMELEDIKSVEDLSGPSTSSGSGVANTSFISDDMPGFSGAHFSGLKGKSFSLDITSHSEA